MVSYLVNTTSNIDTITLTPPFFEKEEVNCRNYDKIVDDDGEYVYDER